MYWLRWHYHVKDIAGAPYKIKKKERKKRKEKKERKKEKKEKKKKKKERKKKKKRKKRKKRKAERNVVSNVRLNGVLNFEFHNTIYLPQQKEGNKTKIYTNGRLSERHGPIELATYD